MSGHASNPLTNPNFLYHTISMYTYLHDNKIFFRL